MKYEEDLARCLKNPDAYMWFKNRSDLSYLEGIAEDSYDKGTTEGYLGALLIYHQLAEKIILLLVQYSDLYLKAVIYPDKVDTSYKHLDTFSKIINKHNSTIVFEKKSTIIKNARELNDIRNKLMHHIVETPTEDKINELAVKGRDNFYKIFNNWKVAMRWFYNRFDRIRAEERIQKLFTKYSFI